MSTVTALKREVSELQQIVNPKSTAKRYAVIWAQSRSEQPHGVYGNYAQVLESDKPTVERAMSLQWELKELGKAYKDGFNSWRNPKQYIDGKQQEDSDFYILFPTLESYLEDNRCKCGKHGSEYNQPFGEVTE